jgi:hypothetical protein
MGQTGGAPKIAVWLKITSDYSGLVGVAVPVVASQQKAKPQTSCYQDCADRHHQHGRFV